MDHPGGDVLHGERHQQLRSQLPCPHAPTHDLQSGQPDGQHVDGDGFAWQAVHQDQVRVGADDHDRHCHLHGDVGHEPGELEDGKAVFSEEGDKEAVEELMAALEAEQTERLKELMFGIGLLIFAMLLSARMGIYQVLIFSNKQDHHCTAQEVLYSRHGKHAKEALFYTHALPLPGFLLLGHDILR